MSINDKINAIKSDISNAYEAVADKGGVIPSISGSANLAEAISSIPEGGVQSDLEYEWWSPKMTSNTEPSPYVASANTESSGFEAYRSFDENKDTYWYSANDTTHWIQIDIGETRKNIEIAGISISTKASFSDQLPTGFIIRGSNDSFVWIDILKVDDEVVSNPESYYSREYYFKPSHYRYYRLYITKAPSFNSNTPGKVRIFEILFYRAIGNSYAVTSFNGRTGDIVPQDGDYSAEKISFSSENLEATNVHEAIEELSEKGGSAGGVSGIINWDDINGRPTFNNVSRRDVQKIILKSDGWDEDNKQTVAALTVLEDETKQYITPVPAKDSYDAYYDSNIMIIGQGKGEVYFKADDKPSEDINVLLFIEETVGVSEAYNGSWEWFSPKMTSNTKPAPYKVYYENNYNDEYLYNLFDGRLDTSNPLYTSIPDSKARELIIDFGQPVFISGIRFCMSTTNGPRYFYLSGSNDEQNEKEWTIIYESNGTEYENFVANNWYDYFFKIEKYRYYRINLLPTSVPGSINIGVKEIEFYKWEESE